MIHIQPGLYVVIEQLETPLAPLPRPLSHGFSRDVAYLVLGAFSLAESADAYLSSPTFRLPRLTSANGRNGDHPKKPASVARPKRPTIPRSRHRGRGNGAA